jgi:hypothetical protein
MIRAMAFLAGPPNIGAGPKSHEITIEFFLYIKKL